MPKIQTAETEMAKEFYATINRNDVPALLNFFHPQIVRVEFEGSPNAGTYRGPAEIQAHVAQGRGTWAEGSCEPEKFIVAGDKVVVFLYVRVRLKNKSEWIEGRFADGLTFKDGKIIEFHSFGDRKDALKWAGAKDEN